MRQGGAGKFPQLVRDGVPDLEVRPPGRGGEEDAAVAGVERAAVEAVGAARAEGGGGDEAGDEVVLAVVVLATVPEVGQEAEHGSRTVALGEAAAEAWSGDDAAPPPTHGGGAGRPAAGGGGSPRRARPSAPPPCCLLDRTRSARGERRREDFFLIKHTCIKHKDTVQSRGRWACLMTREERVTVAWMTSLPMRVC